MARRGCGWVGGLRVIVGVGIGIADWSVDSGLGAVSGAFGNGGGGDWARWCLVGVLSLDDVWV